MITIDEIKRISELAKIELKDDRINTISTDLNALLELADIAVNADLSVLDLNDEDDIVQLREDVVSPSLPLEKVLQNAGEAHDGFFVARG